MWYVAKPGESYNEIPPFVRQRMKEVGELGRNRGSGTYFLKLLLVALAFLIVYGFFGILPMP